MPTSSSNDGDLITIAAVGAVMGVVWYQIITLSNMNLI